MSSDVVLTSALRSNLLSLQRTQNLIDQTQFNLATGRDVNSALDNPQNFFTAQSLSNRANDLSSLLDGIGQSIRTIEAADQGVTALTDLVDQASSIADQARAALNSVNNSATATSDSTELADLDAGDTLVGNITGAAAADAFTIEVGDDGSAQTFTLTTETTLNSLVAEINDRAAANDLNFSASVTNGQLQIQSTNGERLVLGDAAGDGFLSDIGLLSGDADNTSQTFLVGNTLSIDLTTSGSSIDAQTTIDDLTEFAGFSATADALTFQVDGGTTVTLFTGDNAGTTSISELVDAINAAGVEGGNLEGLSASFDDATDQIIITSDTAEVDNFVAATTGGATVDIGQSQSFSGTALDFRPSSGGADSTLQNLSDDYNEIRSQIDSLVQDANYRGTNLLAGDDLVTTFNESGESTLSTTGVNFTSSGLGINEADFTSSVNIQESIDEIASALNSVRAFGGQIANDLSIIQTRQDFTENLINTLESGSDDLTVADQNEEGANLLALQTRQQLGVTSLSLASQSQQAVLRLF